MRLAHLPRGTRPGALTEPAARRQNFISGIERKEQQKQKERKDLETRLKAEKESRQKEVKRLTDQRDKLLGALTAATISVDELTHCVPSTAGSAEIEEINTTNAAEVAKLENGTKEQEELNTKNHDAAVRSLLCIVRRQRY